MSNWDRGPGLLWGRGIAYGGEPLSPRNARLALGAILILAAMLRLLGVTWGLPGPTHLLSYQPDEYFALQAALHLLDGYPNPH